MKIPLSIFAGLAVGIVGYLVYKKMYATGTTTPANPATPAPPGSASSNTPAPVATAPASTPTKTLDLQLVLKKGMRDGAGQREIKKLQFLLGLPEDGVFGSQTEAALTRLAQQGMFTGYPTATYGKQTNLGAIWAYNGLTSQRKIDADAKYPVNAPGAAVANGSNGWFYDWFGNALPTG